MNKKRIVIAVSIVVVLVVVAVFVLRRDGDMQEEKGIFGRFFPGGEEQQTPPAVTLPGTSAVAKPASVLNQLSQAPIAGAVFASSSVRFVERATGHVVEVGPRGQQPRRVSNTTIPGVFEALFGQEGERAILRVIDNSMQTKNVAAIFANGATEGVFVDPEIRSFAASPDRTRLLSLRPAGTRFTVVTSTFEYKEQKEVFSTPFGDFTLSWPEKNTVVLVTKPSVFVDGFLYAINLGTGALEKIIGGIPGLNAKLSPDTASVLLSRRGRTKPIETVMINRKTGASSTFPFNTLAEKCLWSRVMTVIYCAVPFSIPTASYPDDWYKGMISFDDSFIKIHAETLESEVVFAEGGFDAMNLFADPDEQFLFFTNKKDGTLWSIKLP